jgi:predicted transcriptional regulator
MKGVRGTNNPLRDELDRYISDHPGCTFNLLEKAFRMNKGTLRYHLEILERESRIKKTREGRSNRYFPDYMARFRTLGSGVRDLSNGHRRVLTVIEGDPGITRKGILSHLEISRASLTRALSDLKERRMIKEIGKEGGPSYEAITSKKLAGEIIAILVTKVLDGEMDMEMFRSIRDRIECDLSDRTDGGEGE